MNLLGLGFLVWVEGLGFVEISNFYVWMNGDSIRGFTMFED